MPQCSIRHERLDQGRNEGSVTEPFQNAKTAVSKRSDARYAARATITVMVAAFWRHALLTAFAGTLLLARQAAADPSLHATAKTSQATDPEARAQLSPPGSAQL